MSPLIVFFLVVLCVLVYNLHGMLTQLLEQMRRINLWLSEISRQHDAEKADKERPPAWRQNWEDKVRDSQRERMESLKSVPGAANNAASEKRQEMPPADIKSPKEVVVPPAASKEPAVETTTKPLVETPTKPPVEPPKPPLILEQPVPEPSPAPSAPPREPTAFELRIRALRNWFLYGNPLGKNSGESVEKMVATTWLLRAGVLVILFTSAFLLKLSIERGILAPEGRVALSYLCGAALLLCGIHRRLRRNYWSLGQALAGIGLGIFYFSSFAMVSMYHLVGAPVGGAVMVLVTITAGVLSDRLSSLAIAMVTMLGGFATPLLLSTGVCNFPGLSAYLLLLGAGVLWLANRKNWQQLTWLAMLFTYGIFALAIQKHFNSSHFPVCQTSLALFLVLYSTSVFIHNVRLRVPATAMEIIGLLGNSSFFFALSVLITPKTPGSHLALAPLTIGLSCYYLAHAIFLQRRGEAADRNLLLIFCALAGFYLSLTFPVVLTGEWLGAAWALQGLMMLWLGYKLQSRFIRCCAWTLYLLTLGRLAIWDMSNMLFYYRSHASQGDDGFWLGVLARAFQYLIPTLSLALAARLVKVHSVAENRPSLSASEITEPQQNLLAALVPSVAFVLGFIFLRLEFSIDLRHGLDYAWLAGINLVWVGMAGLALWLLKRRVPGWWLCFFALLWCCILARMAFDFLFKPQYWQCCLPDFAWSAFTGILLNTLVLTFGIWYFSRLLPSNGWSRYLGLSCRIAWPVMLFFHSTRELDCIIDNKLPGLRGGGISVLWSIFAFVLLFNGLRKSQRVLRYLGLGLFSVVVFKVFLLDMGRLDAIYRVIAFLIFGVLLMCAAFIYLRFWRKEEK